MAQVWERLVGLRTTQVCVCVQGSSEGWAATEGDQGPCLWLRCSGVPPTATYAASAGTSGNKQFCQKNKEGKKV